MPEITNISYIVTNKKTNTTETRTALGTLGGDYTKFKISLDAKATSGVSKVTAKFSDTIKYELHCSVDHDDANSHTWQTKTKNADGTFTSYDIDIADLSGIKKFDIIVEDGIPNDPMKKEMSVEFDYDNTAPTVNIKTVSGTAGVKQTMEFDTNESSMNYFIVTNTDATEDDVKDLEDNKPTDANQLYNKWTLIKNTEQNANDDYTLSNSVVFDDTDTVNHTKRYALYLVDLGFTTLTDLNKATDPFDELKDVKFWIKAVDKCGNIGYENTVVTVDPQGNRPVVALQSGSGTLKEGSTNEYQDKTAGGSIRFDGTVTDDREAKYVWMQVDSTGIKRDTNPVASDGFKKDDLTKLKTAGYTIGDMRTNETVSSVDSIAEAEVSNYGIRIPVNGNSWNFTINENSKFNLPSDETGEAILVITIYATDADSVQGSSTPQIHRSRPITQTIFIDSQRPYIKQDSLRLVHYTGNTEDASQSYTEGASVQGIWYLQGEIIDTDNGIKSVKIGETEHVSFTGDYKENISGDSHYYVRAVERSGKYDYKFSVPIGNAEDGKVGTASVTISAKEKTEKELDVEKTYSVTYDNKAPEFITTASDVNVSLSQDVNNTNGFYYFGAKASEADVNNVPQSGVERIAFYFTRDLTYGLQTNDPSTYSSHTQSTTKDLFDVMIYHANTDSTDVASGNMIVDYDSMKYEDGLYWHTISGTVNGPTFTITATDAETKKKNLHIGGLAKINGVIYLINGVSGNNVTLSSNVTNESITVTADFAVCNVIDHSGERTGSTLKSAHEYGYGYYTDGIGDDGDMIMETFTKSSSDWIFDASINSKNLPDGPIKLHMVAFDKAGNCSEEYTMTGTVKNNAPRIAGLKIGTDLNGNGIVDSDEFVNTYGNQYYSLGMDGKNEKFEATFPIKATPEAAQTSLLTIKGLTVVKPEIVGGNGKLTYSYSVKDYDNVNKKWGKKTITNPGQETETVTWDYETAENENAEITVDGPESGIGIGTTDAVANVSDIILPVSDFIGTTDGTDSQLIKDGLLKKFTFKFKDSTPSADANDTSSSSTSKLNVILDVALRETKASKNWILPFYWNSKTDNSLFKQSAEEGHIELAKDWVTTTSFSGTSGEYDADPKVSGRIKIEGIAQDDTLLNAISVQFGKKVGGTGGFTANTEKAIATYNAAGGSWTVTALENDGSINSTTGWASAVQQATYQDLKDVGIITAIPDGKEATSKVPYTSQDYGHIVHWILYLDTALVKDTAATDVTVTATATDRAKPKWSSTSNAPAYTSNTVVVTGDTTDDEGNSVDATNSGAVSANGSVAALSGRYRVDVVPYIKKISTTVRTASGLKDSNIRSASGKYSILANNTSNIITVNGFNFSTTALVAKIADTATSAGTGITSAAGGGTGVTITAANTATATITNSSITKSGYLELFSNGVRTLNNINNNNSYGTAKNSSGVQLAANNATVSDYENAYNREADYYTTKNVQLTDDRYLRFFDMKDTGKKNGYYPNMIMDGNDPVFGFVDLNGTTDSTYGNNDMARMKAGYQPQRAKFSGSNGTQSSIEYLIGGLSWDQMAMAKDAAGKYLHATVYNYSESNMAFIYNTFASDHTWKPSTGYYATSYKGAWGLGGSYAAMKNGNTWRIEHSDATGNNAIALESIEYGTNGALVGRYQNLKLFVKGDSTKATGAKVYMAYYDDNTTYKDVIFRTFRVAKSATGNTNELHDDGIYSNLTEQNTSGRIAVRPENNTTVRGSKYLDIGVTSDNHVIIVFYDMQEGKLRMYYSGNEIDGSSITPTPNWTAASVTFPSYVGTDVSMVIDGSNGIHITASDSTDSDLVYMYIPSYNSSTLKTVRVDQAFSVGTWTSIKVKGNATDGYIPYIAYYNATETGSRDSIKLAYFADTVNKISSSTQDKLQGVDSNGYTTGKWEYMTVPSITPPQGGDTKFRSVCLDFDGNGLPVVGYLGTNLEFGKWFTE